MSLAVPRTDSAEVAGLRGPNAVSGLRGPNAVSGLRGPNAIAERARPGALAGDRLLPVADALRPLLPDGGLRRGSVVAVDGSTSLALALVAAASAEGSWCAAVAVGRPSLHPEAAAELGVALERFPLVAALPGTGPGGWPWVVAALLDAVDVVVAWPPPRLRAADARRLVARGRERGAVLVLAVAGLRGPNAVSGLRGPNAVSGLRGPNAVAGLRGPNAVAGWPEAVDVRLGVAGSVWEGIGSGHGRLQARRVQVTATGRGAAARERRAALWLPAAGGGVAAAEPTPFLSRISPTEVGIGDKNGGWG